MALRRVQPRVMARCMCHGSATAQLRRGDYMPPSSAAQVGSTNTHHTCGFTSQNKLGHSCRLLLEVLLFLEL